MKYIELYERYSEQNVKNMLLKSQKKSQIDINAPIKDVLKNLDDNDISKIGTFEGFIEQDGSFISHSDQQRMKEYVEKIKNLGVDTSNIEKILPKYMRFVYLQNEEGVNSFGRYEMSIPKYVDLVNEYESLFPIVDESEIEIKRLATEANKII